MRIGETRCAELIKKFGMQQFDRQQTEGRARMTTPLMWSMALLLLVVGASTSGIALRNQDTGMGPVPVNLGQAGTFAILTKTGITDVSASAIKGDVGTSPITGAAILIPCREMLGRLFTVDAAGPLPCAVTNATMLTTAVSDMEFAYDDAAGRRSPDVTELGAGQIGGLTLVPGLYKWGTGLLISKDVTLAGGPNDVWIFQVAGTLKQANAKRVILAGGAQPRNIFWQVAGAVTLGTTAHFEGVVLAKTMIAVNTGASVNGRLLAQTAVTLQQNAVTQPAP
jgi:Ice-binding-like